MSATTPVPPEPASPPSSGGVRRHHTITAASRTVRGTARDAISEEAQNPELWNEDEVVGDDWVGGVGAVGEKSSLHRQASLPTKYHRAFQPAQGSKSGTMTPKSVNSLTAIAGHEGDEEEWEREIGGYNANDEEASPGGDAPAPLEGEDASPPAAGSGVRRHVSLTYGAQGSGAHRPKLAQSGLRRSGTLQTMPAHPPPSEEAVAAAAQEEEYTFDDPGSYDEEIYGKPYVGPTSPVGVGRGSPWTHNNGEYRVAPGTVGGANAIDDVQRALSVLEISSNNGQSGYAPAYQGGQSAHPPRFNPSYPPPNQQPGMRGVNANRANASGQSPANPGWDPKERSLTPRTSNPNLQQNFHGRNGSGPAPDVPSIPAQYIQQQHSGAQQPRLGVSTNVPPAARNQSAQTFTPIDVPSLIATKGYNPTNFETRPTFARFFVIKSYTEDDVHKSLKYEIWSSTDPGNKRLDKAFKEVAGRGPIYLFFSVNASGHFCGMAEMLTPVDYSRSSTVWASDKWKGVFKVRWVFVRDIPNVNLRHIKLNNTQERKPVTNSRDTQELLPDAGQEMLRIFHTHPARTSLLQDFAFYELQAMQKVATGQSGSPSPIATPSNMGSPQMSPVPQAAQPFNNALAYQMPQMSPMMQMQMMGMNLGGQFAMNSATMQQNVLRNPSPGPIPGQQQQFMGMPGF
ncbi:YTH-domain-containing protein [Cylindrobasidium torrendii FP15055 ss-10]|uniref:YTH-domain-containing protein n=1 Tax=Cylindrobasidium torrendii FP15055 ss-10 TaxID=1314674 RepID=A0A0D7BLF9_9AGAR|nr:YTH-domain-containing protein [Cylindrobasidium torrendii FP15055 ss-10]